MNKHNLLTLVSLVFLAIGVFFIYQSTVGQSFFLLLCGVVVCCGVAFIYAVYLFDRANQKAAANPTVRREPVLKPELSTLGGAGFFY